MAAQLSFWKLCCRWLKGFWQCHIIDRALVQRMISLHNHTVSHHESCPYTIGYSLCWMKTCVASPTDIQTLPTIPCQVKIYNIWEKLNLTRQKCWKMASHLMQFYCHKIWLMSDKYTYMIIQTECWIRQILNVISMMMFGSMIWISIAIRWDF